MDFVWLVSGSAFNPGNLITDILFCICCIILLGQLRLDVRSILMNALEVVLLYAYCVVVQVLEYELLQTKMSFPALAITLVTYALIQHKRTVTDRIVRCVTFMSAFILIVSMTGVEREAISFLKRVSWGMSVPSAVSYVAMLAFAIILRRFSIERFSYVPRYYVLLIVLVDVLGAYAGYSFIAYTLVHIQEVGDSYANIVLSRYEHNVSVVNLQVDVSFLLLMLVSYLMFYVLAKEHDQRTELLVTKKSEIDAMSMAQVTRDSYERIREMRHELKNHDAYVSALLEAGEYEKAKAYFEEHASERAKVLTYVSCGNPLIDSIVNSKMALARACGVEVQTALAVPPSLPFEDGDIFRLLANLMDNAIEGTQVSDSPAGPIELRIRPVAGYYLIVVSNPCNARRVKKSSSGEFITTKGDADLHGYGTKVVRQIAEKYQGSARFSVKDGTFTASVMLARGTDGDGGEDVA
jgi:signal transduction histidine kinase